jgi:hypothetical protein
MAEVLVDRIWDAITMPMKMEGWGMTEATPRLLALVECPGCHQRLEVPLTGDRPEMVVKGLLLMVPPHTFGAGWSCVGDWESTKPLGWKSATPAPAEDPKAFETLLDVFEQAATGHYVGIIDSSMRREQRDAVLRFVADLQARAR